PAVVRCAWRPWRSRRGCSPASWAIYCADRSRPEQSSAHMIDRQRFLADLGRRLREARTHAGLSVSDVARRAHISRRHVTEAEAGRANPSVLKLAELARALTIPLGDLFDPAHAGPGRSGRASERIALVGLRGAGKSTIGRKLALALEVP